MSKKITRYMNVESNNLLDLGIQVRDMILIGWEPLGSVTVVKRSTIPGAKTRYIQTLAMRGDCTTDDE